MSLTWVTVDNAQVLGAMSVETVTLHQNWLAAHPEKAGRLAQIIASVVSEFRSGIATNPANVMDPDPGKLPDSCIRYCDTLIIFELKVEMNAAISDAEMLATGKAEIFLRQIYYSHFVVAGDDTATASPSYGPAAEQATRRLEG